MQMTLTGVQATAVQDGTTQKPARQCSFALSATPVPGTIAGTTLLVTDEALFPQLVVGNTFEITLTASVAPAS